MSHCGSGEGNIRCVDLRRSHLSHKAVLGFQRTAPGCKILVDAPAPLPIKTSEWQLPEAAVLVEEAASKMAVSEEEEDQRMLTAWTPPPSPSPVRCLDTYQTNNASERHQSTVKPSEEGSQPRRPRRKAPLPWVPDMANALRPSRSFPALAAHKGADREDEPPAKSPLQNGYAAQAARQRTFRACTHTLSEAASSRTPTPALASASTSTSSGRNSALASTPPSPLRVLRPVNVQHDVTRGLSPNAGKRGHVTQSRCRQQSRRPVSPAGSTFAGEGPSGIDYHYLHKKAYQPASLLCKIIYSLLSTSVTMS